MVGQPGLATLGNLNSRGAETMIFVIKHSVIPKELIIDPFDRFFAFAG